MRPSFFVLFAARYGQPVRHAIFNGRPSQSQFLKAKINSLSCFRIAHRSADQRGYAPVRCPRIFSPQPLAAQSTLELAPEASHHLARVLRMQSGDALIVFNGEGGEYRATITAVDKRTVRIATEQFRETVPEPALDLHLGIAMSKGERMDWIVQKATELGVTRITPLHSERVELKLQGERTEKKLSHWRGVAIAACEQCGRNRLPAIGDMQMLAAWLEQTEAAAKFVLHHRTAAALEASLKPASVALLVGPEGGLSESEIAAAERQGFAPLRLGPRVLRTETAPLAAISVLQYLWGDLGS
jgi:16S rRNA (uracil1498-N3)-methyltransferase